MKLQNVDAAIYTKAADAVASGKYKLVYEKAGHIYGSKSGVPSIGDYCFNKPNKAAKATTKKAAEVKAPVVEKVAETKNDVPAVAEAIVEQHIETKE